MSIAFAKLYRTELYAMPNLTDNAKLSNPISRAQKIAMYRWPSEEKF